MIAATNKDLEAEIRAGRFREDLYFRLNVIPFHVPPLRERREDVPLLVRHFMGVLERRARPAAARGRRRGALALARLPWPGNVRELRNILERLVIMTPSERIELRHLPASLSAVPGEAAQAGADAVPGAAGPDDGTLVAAREEFERRYILQRYRECGGNMSRTAEALGVERSNLYRKMKAYGLLPAKRDREDDAIDA